MPQHRRTFSADFQDDNRRKSFWQSVTERMADIVLPNRKNKDKPLTSEEKKSIGENIRLLIYRRCWWHIYENDYNSIQHIHNWFRSNRERFEIKNIDRNLCCIEPNRAKLRINDRCRNCLLAGTIFYDRHTCTDNRLFQLFREGRGKRFASLWMIRRIEELIESKGWEEGLDEQLATVKRFKEEFRILSGRSIRDNEFIRIQRIFSSPFFWDTSCGEHWQLEGIYKRIYCNIMDIEEKVREVIESVKQQFIPKKIGFKGRKVIRASGKRKRKAHKKRK